MCLYTLRRVEARSILKRAAAPPHFSFCVSSSLQALRTLNNETFILSVGTNNSTKFCRSKIDPLYFFHLHDGCVFAMVSSLVILNVSAGDQIYPIRLRSQKIWLDFPLFFSSREEIRPVSISMIDTNMSTRPAGGELFLGFIILPYIFLKPFPGLRFSLSPDCVLTLQIKTGFNGVLNKVPVEQTSASAFSPLHLTR